MIASPIPSSNPCPSSDPQPRPLADPPASSPINRPANFIIQAPAKLNLALGITPRIVEGKHLLTSVFCSISLSDTLTFSYDPGQPRWLSIELHCDRGIKPLQLPPERNIVSRAVSALEQATNSQLPGGLSIRIDKRVPAQAGLGGGSSDAAATLMAAADILGISRLSKPVLSAARQLGADVSFFLYGGCAVMGGFGDQILRQLPQPRLDIVLVQPPGGISTADAYRAFDADPQPLPDIDALVKLLDATGERQAAQTATDSDSVASRLDATKERQVAPCQAAQAIAGLLANNLSPAACSLMPGLQALINDVSAQPGVLRAMLTGSGSVVFGVCASQSAAANAAAHFQSKGLWAHPCSTA